jgi:branched-subunit amino acid transport protein
VGVAGAAVNGPELWWLIGAMALLTFALRASFIVLPRIRLPRIVEGALAYVPAAVLAAIVAPAIVSLSADASVAVQLPRWAAAAVGVLVALVHVTVPVVVLMLATAISHIDRDYEKAAQSLGADVKAFLAGLGLGEDWSTGGGLGAWWARGRGHNPSTLPMEWCFGLQQFEGFGEKVVGAEVARLEGQVQATSPRAC